MWLWPAVGWAGDGSPGCGAEIVDDRFPALEAAIAFDAGKATLTSSASPAIDALACALGADPSLDLYVGVHTDARGTEGFNLTLTAARADAIAAALVERGVDHGRIVAAGYGESRPLTADPSPAAQATNRRVELSTHPLPAPPVAPAPPVVPAPAPAPVDACARWRALGEALPWPSCTGTPRAFTCARTEGAAALAEVAARCLGSAVSADGPDRFVETPAGTVTFAGDGTVSLR